MTDPAPDDPHHNPGRAEGQEVYDYQPPLIERSLTRRQRRALRRQRRHGTFLRPFWNVVWALVGVNGLVWGINGYIKGHEPIPDNTFEQDGVDCLESDGPDESFEENASHLQASLEDSETTLRDVQALWQQEFDVTGQPALTPTLDQLWQAASMPSTEGNESLEGFNGPSPVNIVVVNSVSYADNKHLLAYATVLGQLVGDVEGGQMSNATLEFDANSQYALTVETPIVVCFPQGGRAPFPIDMTRQRQAITYYRDGAGQLQQKLDRFNGWSNSWPLPVGSDALGAGGDIVGYVVYNGPGSVQNGNNRDVLRPIQAGNLPIHALNGQSLVSTSGRPNPFAVVEVKGQRYWLFGDEAAVQARSTTTDPQLRGYADSNYPTWTASVNEASQKLRLGYNAEDMGWAFNQRDLPYESTSEPTPHALGQTGSSITGGSGPYTLESLGLGLN